MVTIITFTWRRWELKQNKNRLPKKDTPDITPKNSMRSEKKCDSGDGDENNGDNTLDFLTLYVLVPFPPPLYSLLLSSSS